jgi:hypothetical protein
MQIKFHTLRDENHNIQCAQTRTTVLHTDDLLLPNSSIYQYPAPGMKAKKRSTPGRARPIPATRASMRMASTPG